MGSCGYSLFQFNNSGLILFLPLSIFAACFSNSERLVFYYPQFTYLILHNSNTHRILFWIASSCFCEKLVSCLEFTLCLKLFSFLILGTISWKTVFKSCQGYSSFPAPPYYLLSVVLLLTWNATLVYLFLFFISQFLLLILFFILFEYVKHRVLRLELFTRAIVRNVLYPQIPSILSLFSLLFFPSVTNISNF